MNIKAEIDKKALAEIQQSINNLSILSNKTMEDCVRFAAGRFCRSMMVTFDPTQRHTQKHRELVINPKLTPENQEIAKDWLIYLQVFKKQIKPAQLTPQQRNGLKLIKQNNIKLTSNDMAFLALKIYHQKTEPTYKPTREGTKDKRYIIKNRGLAKRIWSIMEARCKVMPQGKSTGEWQFLYLSIKSGIISMTIHNMLTYLTKYNPRCVNDALDKTNNGLKGFLEYSRKKLIDSSFKGKGIKK